MDGEKSKEKVLKYLKFYRRGDGMKRNFAILLLYIGGIVLSIMIGLVMFGPIVWWNNMPDTPLNIWIVDKTVPTPDYREHKGLMWILNHNKVINEKTGKELRYDKDYFGFFPVSEEVYDVRMIPDTKEYPDLIYLTDTYGVYTDDYLVSNAKGTSSNLLYGGLDKVELNKILSNIGYGNTLIGEFNIASSPTNVENRKELEAIFGVKWSGWKGRYFKELEHGFEVPKLMVENYEKQEMGEWNFKGPGYVLVSENDEIVVLENEKHIGDKGLSIKFQEGYNSEFEVEKNIPYYYWFEFLKADENTEIIANYYLDLSSEGEKVLNDLGLSTVFTAVTRKTNSEYTSYYFCGDFADLDHVNKNWNYYGLQKIKKTTSFSNKEAPDYFYWNAYVPMMTKIISDLGNVKEQREAAKKDKKPYLAKVEGKDFYVYSQGQWEKRFLKGVNMGAAKPGTFPGDLAITKEEYLRWFKYISQMNADVIRVYTTLKPEFYDALYLYNKTVEKPLYLIQGVWVKEEDTAELLDAYADEGRIINSFIKDSIDLVDVLHGNAQLPEKKGFASGEYKSDVSEYVIGWILGIEWDPNFVEVTNSNNPYKKSYEGEYLYTSNASPFEVFLCEVGDKVIEYEKDKYNSGRPLSFSNWPTTDMLSHPNEPYIEEDLVSVNLENIKAQENFEPGLYASYHIYPYYPEFMNYQHEYANFIDDDGKINTYKAYLRDLIDQHTMPVMVAEFGIPASRGNTHINIHMGYDQGHHDEKEQGIIIESLLQDIYDEGYCGGLIFTWQDEWFKRTWNTMDFDISERRPFWSNPQTSEQEFGVLAFEPGIESICNIDGDISDWVDDVPIHVGENIKLYVKSDEKYLYMMVDADDFDFNKDIIIIPIDTIGGQGNIEDSSNNIEFSRPADFIIRINGRENSRILVDSYYDSFQQLYGERLKMIPTDPFHKQNNSGVFSPIYLCLSREVTLPEDNIVIPFSQYETGMLKYGISNPNYDEFNSLSDFYEENGKVEIRIPWQLLNVMDPSTRSVMKGFHGSEEFFSQQVKGFYLGAGVTRESQLNSTIGMDFYSWELWNEPTYHERLKPSYYIMKNAFGRIK